MDYENENRAPRLLAATWSLTVVAGVFLGLRLYCKRIRSTGLWWDDHFMLAAWVSMVVSVSINTYITTLGMGRHYSTISPDDEITINRITIIVAVFAIISSGLSKTSFAVTLYRLFSAKLIRLFLLFVVVAVNLFLNSVWITGFAKCQPIEKVWDGSVPGTCWDKKKLAKWQTFASYYSSIIDFVLAFLPWKTLLKMTMPLRERIGVTVAMSMGVIAGITGIVKSVLVVSLTDPDITSSRVDLTIWTVTEPAVTIMAASLPVLRMLYRELRSTQRSNYNDNGVLSSRYAKSENQTGNRRNTIGNQSKTHRKGNTVTVMSTTGWQESQEALQRDLEVGTGTSGSQSGAASLSAGIMKTEEVRVQSSPKTSGSSADYSFEMVSFKKSDMDWVKRDDAVVVS